jgi:hypothetical protein
LLCGRKYGDKMALFSVWTSFLDWPSILALCSSGLLNDGRPRFLALAGALTAPSWSETSMASRSLVGVVDW